MKREGFTVGNPGPLVHDLLLIQQLIRLDLLRRQSGETFVVAEIRRPEHHHLVDVLVAGPGVYWIVCLN